MATRKSREVTMRLMPSLTSALGSQSTLDTDVKLPSDSTDTISSMSWSPVAEHLAAASWDGRVRVYNIAANGQGTGLCALTVDAPVLDCDWALDGSFYVAGGADSNIYAMDMASTQQAQIGKHEKPVSSVRVVDVPGSGTPIVASGSWDKTVKFWDVRQSAETAVATLACHERVYSMDSNSRFSGSNSDDTSSSSSSSKKNNSMLLFIATADQHVHIVDLRKPTEFLETRASPLENQATVIRAMPDGAGFAIAGIVGKCQISYLDTQYSLTNRDFSFRCHRTISEDVPDATDVWTVNDMQFHPSNPKILLTAGSDGSFRFWDVAKRARKSRYGAVPGTTTYVDNNTNTNPNSSIQNNNNTSSGSGSGSSSKKKNKKENEKTIAGITATAFSRDGAYLAYAVGYDWSRGCAANSPATETRIMVHKVRDEEVN